MRIFFGGDSRRGARSERDFAASMRQQEKQIAGAAKAIGPQTIHQISPAVIAGGVMYATVIPVDLDSGVFIDGPIESQARQTFRNLQILLREAGGDLDHVLHLTIYLIDSADLAGLNAVYKEIFLREPYPARATVIVRELVGPPGLRIEATAHAYIGSA
jgi:2-iminobutanoate/2-iminopropanoate deaminase